VSVVARQYDVNANLVFSWRRRYRDVGEPSPTLSSAPGLVPVTITREPDETAASVAVATAAAETIEIEVSGLYRVRVGSSFDIRALRRVLDALKNR
jgi:transposase